MDDIPIIGHREFRQEFEFDRHSQALLAKAFEVLWGASFPDLANIHSVQTEPPYYQEALLQEDN